MRRKAMATSFHAETRTVLWVEFFCESIVTEKYESLFAQCIFRITVMSYCYDG